MRFDAFHFIAVVLHVVNHGANTLYSGLNGEEVSFGHQAFETLQLTVPPAGGQPREACGVVAATIGPVKRRFKGVAMEEEVGVFLDGR